MSRKSNQDGKKHVYILSAESYPISPEHPIYPDAVPSEEEWTTVIRKSRKERGVDHELIPAAPAVLNMNDAESKEQAMDALLQRRRQRVDRRHTKKAFRNAALAVNEVRWTRAPSHTMNHSQYTVPFEMSLVNFFRSGYIRYKNELRAAAGLEDVDEKEELDGDQEILECIRILLKKYKLLISGGYVLKYIKASMNDLRKPSVDIDIYVPNNTPERHPEFYDIMAKLFNADLKKSKKSGEEDNFIYDINAFFTKMHDGGTKSTFFKKNGIQSVHKHMRDVNGLYAEMDLVRASSTRTPENIIRNFDLSCCMNWYDGDHLHAMHPECIFNPKNVPSFLSFSYVPIFLGLATEAMKLTSHGRVLKYMMRGYRVSYVNPKSGELTEISVSNMPNAIEALLRATNVNKRPGTFANAMAKIRASPKGTSASNIRAKFLNAHPKFKNFKNIPEPKKKKNTKKNTKKQSPNKHSYNKKSSTRKSWNRAASPATNSGHRKIHSHPPPF
jgi:hypothetical protein